MGRRAKIVCTLGPATSGAERIMALVTAGLDVAPLNMSHGSHDTHLAAYHGVRAACDASGRSVGAIAGAAAQVGAAVGAKALVAFTMTGETARRLARYRSPIPLLAFSTESATRSRLALTWGTETFLVPPVAHTDDMVRQVEAALLSIGRCGRGDVVVLVAGSPPGTPGRTNALRVHRIGDAVES